MLASPLEKEATVATPFAKPISKRMPYGWTVPGETTTPMPFGVILSAKERRPLYSSANPSATFRDEGFPVMLRSLFTGATVGTSSSLDGRCLAHPDNPTSVERKTLMRRCIDSAPLALREGQTVSSLPFP